MFGVETVIRKMQQEELMLYFLAHAFNVAYH